jgi:hypothetical protein
LPFSPVCPIHDGKLLELVNSGEMTIIYTTSEGGIASAEGEQSSSSAKPKPKPKPKPHPKPQTTENDASTVETSGIGRVHFIIGGSLLCALGVFLLDQKVSMKFYFYFLYVYQIVYSFSFVCLSFIHV